MEDTPTIEAGIVIKTLTNGDTNAVVMSRLAEISKEISDIATGKSKAYTTIKSEPGGIVTVRTEVRSEKAGAGK